MIVRPHADGLALITQPDHAALAGRVMRSCSALAAHPRRDAILLAIDEHDNGWREPDAAPTLERSTGQVRDFVHAAVNVRQGVWPRGVARLSADPWAAALVAQHAVAVYDRFRGHRDWTAFFTEMEATRDRLVNACGLPLTTLLDDYPLVRLGDLISLVFCAGWQDPQRIADWTVARDHQRATTLRVVVDPDPFAGQEIACEVEMRVLPSRQFGSDEALWAALRLAAPVRLPGAVAGG